MRVGRTFSAGTSPIPGQDLLVVRHYPDKKSSGPTAEARIVVGSDHTDGNLVLGYKVRPDPSNRHGYYASITGQHDRSALVIGASGSDPTLIWKIRKDNASVPNLTTSVTMTDLFIIQNTSMLYDNFLFLDGVKNSVGIGTATPGASLDVLGKVSSMPTVSTDLATTLTTKGYVESLSLGVGQSWTAFDSTGRTAGGIYQNTTGKPIVVSVIGPKINATNNYSTIEAYVGTAVGSVTNMIDRSAVSIIGTIPAGWSSFSTHGINSKLMFVVPNNIYYRIVLLSNNSNLTATNAYSIWSELR